jgi:hypothetical protein
MCAHFWKFIIYFLSKNDDFNLVGLLIHLLIVEKCFINIIFLRNDGTTQQTVYIRCIYLSTRINAQKI